jgi:hypothetical protein
MEYRMAWAAPLTGLIVAFFVFFVFFGANFFPWKPVGPKNGKE